METIGFRNPTTSIQQILLISPQSSWITDSTTLDTDALPSVTFTLPRTPHNSRLSGVNAAEEDIRLITKPDITQKPFHRAIRETPLVIDELTTSPLTSLTFEAIVSTCTNRLNETTISTVRP